MANETNNKQIVKRVDLDKCVSWANSFVKSKGSMAVPKNYDVVGAVKSLYLQVLETKDKNGNSAIDVCTEASIKKAVMEMVSKGLDPRKKQCYPIVYGKALTLQVGYFGNQRVARTYNPNLSEFHAQVIYDGDDFEDNIELDGRRVIAKHKQVALKDRKPENIIGAYSVVMINELSDAEVMTMEEIKRSWAKSKTGGDTHKQFTVEMAKKTVISRHTKRWANASDDSAVIDDNYDEETPVDIDNDGLEPIDITDYDVTEEAQKETAQEKPKENTSLPTAEDFDDFDNTLTDEEQREILNERVCSQCRIKVSEKIADFSNKKYHKTLCFECQKKQG